MLEVGFVKVRGKQH